MPVISALRPRESSQDASLRRSLVMFLKHEAVVLPLLFDSIPVE